MRLLFGYRLTHFQEKQKHDAAVIELAGNRTTLNPNWSEDSIELVEWKEKEATIISKSKTLKVRYPYHSPSYYHTLLLKGKGRFLFLPFDTSSNLFFTTLLLGITNMIQRALWMESDPDFFKSNLASRMRRRDIQKKNDGFLGNVGTDAQYQMIVEFFFANDYFKPRIGYSMYSGESLKLLVYFSKV